MKRTVVVGRMCALLGVTTLAGVSAPATQEIRDGLAAMSADWTTLREELQNVDGETASARTEAI